MAKKKTTQATEPTLEEVTDNSGIELITADAQEGGVTDTASVVGADALAAGEAGEGGGAYEPEKTYDLFVRKPVTIGSFKYLPRHKVMAKGRLINQIIEEYGEDAIRSADPRD